MPANPAVEEIEQRSEDLLRQINIMTMQLHDDSQKFRHSATELMRLIELRKSYRETINKLSAETN